MKKRSDGRYKRTFTFNGRQYCVYGYNKQELDQKEHEKRLELEGMRESRANPTLDEYYEKWTEARRGSVKEATLIKQSFQYAACSFVRIQSAGIRFGEIRIKEITVDDIREVQKALKPERTTTTVNDMIAHLSHIFHDAVLERHIDFNPCSPVKPLKRTEPQARDTVHRALTQEEQEIFFKEAETSFYFDVFRIAVLTGMRCGEIGALYLSDISGDKIRVERTITKTETGAYRVGEDTKTWKGKRNIPLNDSIREVIEHQKQINRMLDGDKITSINERIFKAPERGLLMATPADREIARICKRTGIEKFTMHALRATFATRAIEQGIAPRTLQELLGHTDYSLTMNLYGHVVDTTKQAAMEKLKIVL